MTTYSAPAKINLSLKVMSKREDGFHNVDILMAKLDLEDKLDFHNSRTTTLLCDTPGVPTDEGNLVVKAIREFEKAYGRKAKQRITLTKNIPFGAGLGGGSADAAITLQAVNEILGTGYSYEELHAMAAAIGSDVPFFLNPVISRCTGRGEIVTPVPELAGWTSPIVLIKPQFGVSTPSAYKGLHGAHRMKGVTYNAQTVDGIKLVNDSRYHIYLHRIIYRRHLYKGCIDRETLLNSCRNLIGKEHILRLGQILKVDHLSIVTQHLAECLSLLSIPLFLL